MIGINNKLIHFIIFSQLQEIQKRLIFTNELMNQTKREPQRNLKFISLKKVSSQNYDRNQGRPDEQGRQRNRQCE